MTIVLKIFVISLAVLFLSGCAGKTTITEYYPVDKTNKSVTVPAGGNQVFTLIKKGLIQDGWDLQINDSSLLTEKNSAYEKTTMEYKTKYRLLMTMYVDSEGIGTFNVSVIDNKNGKEVMTMFKPKAMGRETPEEVAEKILSWFKGTVNTK